MSKNITIELPDEVFAALQAVAQESGTSMELLALQWMKDFGARSAPASPAADRREARAALLALAGAHDSGDPQSADNDRIDADLGKAYQEDHEPG